MSAASDRLAEAVGMYRDVCSYDGPANDDQQIAEYDARTAMYAALAAYDAEQAQAKPACACRGALKGEIEHGETSCAPAPASDRERERFEQAVTEFALAASAHFNSDDRAAAQREENTYQRVLALYDAARRLDQGVLPLQHEETT